MQFWFVEFVEVAFYDAAFFISVTFPTPKILWFMVEYSQ